MTVSADAAKAGPYTGNGSASSFAFDFKVFADTDIRVVETLISTAVETDLVLNTHYTVARNVDQDNNPGGSITYKVGGVTTALPATKKLTIVGDFSYEQPTDIPNGGAFFAQIIENALDRATMLVKQLKERLDRAAVVPVSSSYTPDQFSDDLITLAAIEADITAVAAADAEVVAVAADLTNINAVAADLAAIDAAPTYAAQAAASAAAAAATLASALWRDVVFVTFANSPVTLTQADNGKLYVADTTSGAVIFNLPQISGVTLPYTVGVKLEAGGNSVTINRSGTDTIDGATSKTVTSIGAGAQLIADIDPAPDKWTAVDFGVSTGDYTDEVKTAGVDFTAGTSTTITLANDYGSETNIAVHFDTAFQGPDTYSLAGTTLTFTSAIPLGVSRVYIKGGVALAIGVPGDGTVATAKLADAAVTAAKLADTAVPDKIHVAASKATPVDADELALVDSAAGNVLKKLTWANLKAGIFTAWGALVNGGTDKTTPADADAFAMMDSAASGATKKLTWANLVATIKSVLLNASGSAPVYACRAWVNFNGTGTVAINASGNVSSITDNGVGDYTVNFTNAFADANYCSVFGTTSDSANNQPGGVSIAVATSGGLPYTMSTTQMRVKTGFGGATSAYDFAVVNAAFYH